MMNRISTPVLMAAVAFALLLALPGCSPDYPTAPSTPPPSRGMVTSLSEYSIDVASSDTVGLYLVDQRGMTLYWTSKDAAKRSSVPNSMLRVWPLFHLTNLRLPPSLLESDFSSFTRKDGNVQTTFRNWPLYYYAYDTDPGDTDGQGIDGKWSVASFTAMGPRFGW